MNTMRFKKVRTFLIVILIIVVYQALLLLPSKRRIHEYLKKNYDTFYWADPQRPRYVCMDFQGGVGNKLFQYAFTYSIVRTKNVTMLISKEDLDSFQKHFLIPSVPLHPRAHKICHRQKRRISRLDCGLDHEITSFKKNTDVHFEGYFQSWRYWHFVEETLRKYFRFHPDLMARRDDVLSRILLSKGYQGNNTHSRGLTLIGIHIRRGDMVTKKEFVDYGYQVADADYIKTAMEYMKKKVKGPMVFIVCSNDIVWSKAVVTTPEAAFVEGTSPELDMALLANCDHFIMTVGSFGWWVGWMTKGIVVYYNKPFRNNTALSKKFAPDYKYSFFYPGWVGLG